MAPPLTLIVPAPPMLALMPLSSAELSEVPPVTVNAPPEVPIIIFAPDCRTRSLIVKFVSTVEVPVESNCAALLELGTPLDQLVERDQLPLPTCHVVCALAPSAPRTATPKTNRPFRQFMSEKLIASGWRSHGPNRKNSD